MTKNTPTLFREGANSSAAPKIWKAAPYLRLSKEDGDKEESHSIQGQNELIESFVCKHNDIMLTGNTYSDDGFSGVNFDRPGFQRLVEDIRTGHVNCVLVKDLSRLGRNYIETGKLLEQFFPFMGVRFIAITDNYDSQNHNAQTDNLIIPFKNLINDAYCADTSQKIRSQLEVKRKKGDYIGSFAPFGYQKDPENHNRLVIDDAAASVVADIFAWKIDGMSQQGIADRLNEHGIPSPLEYKKENGSNYTTVFSTSYKASWSAVAVGRILKNDVYTGVLTQGISSTPNYKVKQRFTKKQDEWVRIEQAHKPIVSNEDFALVANLLNKDTRIAPGCKKVYLFSGMLRCGDCGQGLVRKTVPGSNGIKYVYHVCSTHKKGGCSSHSISEQALYDAMLATIKVHINQCSELGRVMQYIRELPLHQRGTEKMQQRIDGRVAELEKLQGRQVRLYEDYSDGILNKSEYLSFKRTFTKQIEQTEAALRKLNDEKDALLSGGETSEWLQHFQKHRNIKELTRSIVVELVEGITVYEVGKIEVRFRYQQSFDSAMEYVQSLPTGERAVV